ncbi:ABC transporter family protein [Trichomonas vaginalis G3]|uniref:ABC transporter family protein n=1 Tax=Trichomonas vaginalis (strain ATCC PRA-98 / G3) TaxID=412133 RepID=A2G725_TRIV3|nr:ATPase activity, coupled to transmembrane movement of substances [Trichomonas vaginalis G3]EAX87038.1 ABC transporter family protein [Trichomonas vaginalis G3]KAI5509054.1 ATPase activity, coupled to transmembrane movement of substances [Trichomonas vaginalis G3]|eukprot:XP_001299968.1 ABC transporter family protein [Trichomonas vaginalis G3]
MFSLTAWKRFWKSRKDMAPANCGDTPFLSVSHLTKVYKGKRVIKAIDSLDFAIGSGEKILIIGPNGSGKTTLLSSLTGAIPCDEGKLKVNGFNADFVDLQKCTGFCYQENVFAEGLTVKEHLEFFGRLRGASNEKIQDHIDYITSKLNIDDLLFSDPKNLSGGQKRCVSVAMAYIGAPSLVILDEPTSGVDAYERQLLWKMASYFVNTTTIIASHSLEEGESVASRVFVMDEGKIIFMGTPSELRARYKCGYRLKFLMDNETQIVDKAEEVLNFIQKIVPNAVLDYEMSESIMIPVCDEIPKLLKFMDENVKELGINGYTITVEALEHIMLRMLADKDQDMSGSNFD